jgi:signal transduction histidine kinase
MPVWREVSPAEVVRRALKEVEPAAEARKVPLAAHTAAAPASFETDPARLHQILVNLLSNAVRLGPPGRPVTVTVQHGAESIAVAVADEGPGVPAELRERIFEPFERLDPHSGHGTGLGLPVSRRLAELLGGSISVGDRPGGGAVFTLSLPLARRT